MRAVNIIGTPRYIVNVMFSRVYDYVQYIYDCNNYELWNLIAALETKFISVLY